MKIQVDILMAVYNGEKYLEEQLASIAEQTYQDWHLIIRDDASTDRSMQIIKAFRDKYPEGKVEVYKNEPASGSAKNNFCKLIQDAKAEYVMFCDQDDVWISDKIEQTLKQMRRQEIKNSSKQVPVLVHSDLYVVDEHLNIISDSMQKYQKLPKTSSIQRLLIQNYVTGCTMMANRSLMDYLKRAEDATAMVMHDYWAALIAMVFGTIVFIPRPLIKYRQHGDNSVGAMNAAGIKYLYIRFKAGRKQFRERTEATMLQARAFCKVYEYELSKNPYKDLIRAYSELTETTKMHKIEFYISKHVTKYGIIRKIMQFIWS